MEGDQEVVLGDISEREEGDFEMDSDESFDDSFNSDDDHEQSGSRGQPEEVESFEPGNIHPFHSCSFCRFIDFDSKMSSREYLWAKIRTHPSDAPEDCEFFCFCRDQYAHFPDSAALYIYVEHKGGRHFTGSKVGFAFSIKDGILPGQSFLRGWVHSSEWPEFVLGNLRWKN
jgi:hypothetical protein